ncbi:NDR1/HIN1-like protein 13 [Primulina eburnea]|uniref:NDR1/HIN1-like protein 13 n=1 Tax=Primulina eburnea TaxID=1245227 RepID=UPI003C6C4703
MTSTPPATAHQHDQTTNTTNSSSFHGCCCRLFLLLSSFLILFIVAAILVIFLAVKPQKPHFDLQKVVFQYMGISAVTTTQSAATVSLIIHMFFVATNENKVGIKYDEFWFTVMYRGIPLGRGAVPGFYQPAHNVRLVETTIVVGQVNLIQANAAYMLGEASLNDRVALRVVGDIGARIQILGLTSPRVQVSVDCTITFSPTRQTLMSKQCVFDGLSV